MGFNFSKSLIIIILSNLFMACLTEDDDSDDSPTPSENSPTPDPMLEPICNWDGITEDEDVNPLSEGKWEGEVFYEIFVRSFKDSNADGIGDLKGIIEKLDYLNDGDPTTNTDLGITAIWLMPVFESPSYHGYDVLDYTSIEKDYGTLDDFDNLIAAAHDRGIRIILDLMINHTSKDHHWFKEAMSSKDNNYRDYYVWSDKDEGSNWHSTSTGYYYARFSESMPDLNLYHPDIQEEMAYIMEFWFEHGVDGYRLDAVKHYAEETITNDDGSTYIQTDNTQSTHCYLQALRRYMDKYWKEKFFISEIWDTTDNIATYLGDGYDEMAISFDFPASTAIVNAVNYGDPNTIRSSIAKNIEKYPKPASIAPFLRNHDMNRTGSDITSESKQLLAFATLMALPGIPFLYYGEEIGMTGKKDKGDEYVRTPMQWNTSDYAGFSSVKPWISVNADYTTINTESEKEDLESILSFYKKIILARHNNIELQTGDYKDVSVISPTQDIIYSFARSIGNNITITVYNYSSQQQDVVLDLSNIATSWLYARDILLDSDIEIEGDNGSHKMNITIPAYTAKWIKLEFSAKN